MVADRYNSLAQQKPALKKTIKRATSKNITYLDVNLVTYLKWRRVIKRKQLKQSIMVAQAAATGR